MYIHNIGTSKLRKCQLPYYIIIIIILFYGNNLDGIERTELNGNIIYYGMYNDHVLFKR